MPGWRDSTGWLLLWLKTAAARTKWNKDKNKSSSSWDQKWLDSRLNGSRPNRAWHLKAVEVVLAVPSEAGLMMIPLVPHR